MNGSVTRFGGTVYEPMTDSHGTGTVYFKPTNLPLKIKHPWDWWCIITSAMGSYDYNANPKILASQEGRKGGGKILELTEILDRLRGDSAPMLPRLRQEPWVDESYC